MNNKPFRNAIDEELSDTVSSDSNGVSMWLCPLCQQGQSNREELSLHLTGKHSVLPACLDKLLDIAIQSHSTSKDESGFQKTSSDACVEPSKVEDPPRAAQQVAEEEQMKSGDKDTTNPGKETDEEVEGLQDQEGDDGIGSELDHESGLPPFLKVPAVCADSDCSTGKPDTGVEGNTNSSNRPFKCNACLESFVTKTALSVHYNSSSHIQRMRTGSAKPRGDPDAGAFPPRPYISNKPYQCAVCRVSYNHAITLESHLKSVLHQTRSRNASNSAAKTANGSNSTTASNNGYSSSSSSSSSMVPGLVVATAGNAAQLVNTTTSNCNAQPGLPASTATTKDGEPIQPAPSLLTSPVASAQAVSAFLTLLTSNPGSIPHSILPSLFASGAAASPTTPPGTTAPHLIPQAQVLMPLILNGLQSQVSPAGTDSPGQLLPQSSLQVLGLTAAQQALLAQRLSSLQSQWSSTGMLATAQGDVEEKKTEMKSQLSQTLIKQEGEFDTKQEMSEQQAEGWSVKEEIKEDKQGKLCTNALSSSLEAEDNRVEKNIELAGKGLKTDADSEEREMEEDGATCDTKSPCTSATNSLTTPGQPISNSTLASDPDHVQGPAPKNRRSAELKTLVSAKTSPLNASLAFGRSGLGHPNPRPSFSARGPVLSEFQHQVLWAFLESRSEADAASPPRDDCEALGREVGLTEEEVRRWLEDAYQAKEKQKAGELGQAVGKDGEHNMDEEEGDSALTIDESPARAPAQAMDLSSSGERCREKERESQADSCLTSDSENEDVYTSVIVTDEESRDSAMREEQPHSPVKEALTKDTQAEKSSGGGKVLRSTTVFLSDAEDEEDEEGGPHIGKRKKRKRDADGDDVEAKRDRADPDLDLELEAQADPPTPLSLAVDQRGLPSGILHSLPLSLSLAPFSTQFISPYVLSLPSSMVGVGVAEGEGGKVAAFPSAQTIAQFADALNTLPLSTHSQHAQYMANGGDCETALDLSMGKNNSSTAKASTSVTVPDKTAAQKGRLLDGLGLRPTAVGVPSEGGLIVLQVKPESTIAIPATNNSGSGFINHSNLAKTNALLMRAAERDHTSMADREKKESEKEKEQRRPKARRFKDMRRSRTIIQAEQLDILYGCYFKDPNPGKHEFEQISEWVHLPKKVVQIWFQNMRARERKGEVRFISDGTLAAVGKPLIKFTWPLSKPIFSSSPKNATSSTTAASSSLGTTPVSINPKPTPGKDDKASVSSGLSRVKDPVPVSIGTSSGGGSLSATKTKPDPPTMVAMVKIAPKAINPAPQVVAMETTPSSSSPSQKPQTDEEDEEDEEEEVSDHSSTGPGSTNRMIPKVTAPPLSAGSEKGSGGDAQHQHNGVNYWPSKGHIKINTLSREQLGLSSFSPRSPAPTPIAARNSTPASSPRNPASTTPSRPPSAAVTRIPTSTTAVVTTTSTSSPTTPSKPGQREVGFLMHSTPRRPRTHLTCLQLSILQSCYETCAHPNALECEAIGTELGLPLKVVQIWFQNTRAKEKRWRLQQEKLSPGSDPAKKVDISAASYLQYNALRANRPILPKPVQLTVIEASPLPGAGQPAGRETLRGRCEACNVVFESRAAARAHVFSPRHLATLRTTNFGQPAALVNNGSGGTESSSNLGITTVTAAVVVATAPSSVSSTSLPTSSTTS